MKFLQKIFNDHKLALNREEKACSIFIKSFQLATSKISKNFFELPVAGKETPTYRERVYCYELYHQLRSYLPRRFPYQLHGEIDKKSHRLISGGLNPDFLVHVPGKMDNNLIIIEVKTIEAIRRSRGALLLGDLVSLEKFTSNEVGYFKGISLVYGVGNDEVYRQFVEEPFWGYCEEKDVKLDLYLHKELGKPAIQVKR